MKPLWTIQSSIEFDVLSKVFNKTHAAGNLYMKQTYSLFDERNKNLLEASKKGELNRVIPLLEKKANIDTATKRGNTPVMLAAKYGHSSLVKLLLSQKASYDLINFFGMTALMMAAGRGHNENIKLLIEAKANPEEKCVWNGLSPILFSITHKMTHSISLLIELGVKVPTEKRHDLCPTILSLREDQKNQYHSAILLISSWLPGDIWNIVTDYAVDFEPPSKTDCFCLSFWNRPIPVSHQENQEFNKNILEKF
jgi:hypothetical protein